MIVGDILQAFISNPSNHNVSLNFLKQKVCNFLLCFTNSFVCFHVMWRVGCVATSTVTMFCLVKDRELVYKSGVGNLEAIEL